MVRFTALVVTVRSAPSQQVAVEVRRRRRRRGWTLDDTAGRLGVSRRLLAQIEAGRANPSLSTLLSITAGFEKPLVELLAGAGTPSITVQAGNGFSPVLWAGDHGGPEQAARRLRPARAAAVDARPRRRAQVRCAPVGFPGGAARLRAHGHAPYRGRRAGDAGWRSVGGLAGRRPALPPQRHRRPVSFLLAVHEPSGGCDVTSRPPSPEPGACVTRRGSVGR